MIGSEYWSSDLTLLVGSLDASLGSSVVYAPGRPIDVFRVVLVTTIAQTTANAVITVAVRDVDNANSSTKGTFVLPFAGSAPDDVKYVDVVRPSLTPTIGSDGSRVHTTNGGVIEVNPHQEIVFTSDGGGDAGTYAVYIQFIAQGFTGPRTVGTVELAFTPA